MLPPYFHVILKYRFNRFEKEIWATDVILLSLKLTCTGCQYFEVFVIWNKKLKSAAAKLFTLEESKYRIIYSLHCEFEIIRMTLSWSLSEIQAWSKYNFVTNEWSYYMQICHIYMQISKICPLFSEVFVIFLQIFFRFFFSIAMAVCAFIEYQIIVDSFRA